MGHARVRLGEDALDKKRVEEMYVRFLRLEDMFLGLTEHVPLVADLADPRYSVASPKAAEFGLECCMWIETLMGELLSDKRWDDKVPSIQDVRDKGILNMDVYREPMGKWMGFSRGGYAIRDLGGPEIVPFAEWADEKNPQNPEWFRIYSKYKHRRFELDKRFTMGHALKAYVTLVMLVNHWRPRPLPFTRVLEGV